MTLTEDIKYKLSKLTGKDAKRESAFDIVQQYPKTRINGWTWYKRRYDKIHEADRSDECTELYKIYSNYYKPLREMLLKDKTPWKE